jgi:hypothetical protein
MLRSRRVHLLLHPGLDIANRPVLFTDNVLQAYSPLAEPGNLSFQFKQQSIRGIQECRTKRNSCMRRVRAADCKVIHRLGNVAVRATGRFLKNLA